MQVQKTTADHLKSKRSKYPFWQMNPGTSFSTPETTGQEQRIRSAITSFVKYNGLNWTFTVRVNDGMVHANRIT